MEFYIGLIANLIYVNGSQPQPFQQRGGGRDWGFVCSGLTLVLCNESVQPSCSLCGCLHLVWCKSISHRRWQCPRFCCGVFPTDSSVKSIPVSRRSLWQLLGQSQKKTSPLPHTEPKAKSNKVRECGLLILSVYSLFFLSKGKEDEVPWGHSLHFSQQHRVIW